MKHQKQITEHGCTIACIAMITDRPVSDVHNIACALGFDVEKEKGMSSLGVKRLLAELGFITQDVNAEQGLLEGVYEFAVPSLNKVGKLHSIVVHVYLNESSEYEVGVYDPQRGTGKAFYDYNSFNTLAIVRGIRCFDLREIKA